MKLKTWQCTVYDSVCPVPCTGGLPAQPWVLYSSSAAEHSTREEVVASIPTRGSSFFYEKNLLGQLDCVSQYLLNIIEVYHALVHAHTPLPWTNLCVCTHTCGCTHSHLGWHDRHFQSLILQNAGAVGVESDQLRE